MKIIKLNQNGKSLTEEHKKKLIKNHWSKSGKLSPFKGKKHSQDSIYKISVAQKKHMESLSETDKVNRYVKSSCSYRNLPLNEFNGWSTGNSIRIRGSKEYKNWENNVIARDNKCQFPTCLERRKSFLVAHHKDGFNWCIDRRFDENNGAALCKHHHSLAHNSFHAEYGNGNNTEQQYLEWINKHKIKASSIKTLIILTGVPGSGKSWVCNQLTDLCHYISYDDIPKEQHLHLMLDDNIKLPILYDPWRKATSFIKRYSDIFNIKFVAIKEKEEVIKNRLINRGGNFDKNTLKYIKRLDTIAKKADFVGTSDEVLKFLIDVFESNKI